MIPVAPFGRPVPQTAWLEFRKRTGIPVVIDGAATFETAAGQGGSSGSFRRDELSRRKRSRPVKAAALHRPRPAWSNRSDRC